MRTSPSLAPAHALARCRGSMRKRRFFDLIPQAVLAAIGFAQILFCRSGKDVPTRHAESRRLNSGRSSPKRKSAAEFAEAWNRITAELRRLPIAESVSDEAIQREIEGFRAGR